MKNSQKLSQAIETAGTKMISAKLQSDGYRVQTEGQIMNPIKGYVISDESFGVNEYLLVPCTIDTVLEFSAMYIIAFSSADVAQAYFNMLCELKNHENISEELKETLITIEQYLID